MERFNFLARNKLRHNLSENQQGVPTCGEPANPAVCVVFVRPRHLARMGVEHGYGKHLRLEKFAGAG
jgi:hypothetical protein